MEFILLFLAFLSSIVLALHLYWGSLVVKAQVKNKKEPKMTISIFYLIWPALFWALYLTV